MGNTVGKNNRKLMNKKARFQKEISLFEVNSYQNQNYPLNGDVHTYKMQETLWKNACLREKDGIFKFMITGEKINSNCIKAEVTPIQFFLLKNYIIH